MGRDAFLGAVLGVELHPSLPLRLQVGLDIARKHLHQDRPLRQESEAVRRRRPCKLLARAEDVPVQREVEGLLETGGILGEFLSESGLGLGMS